MSAKSFIIITVLILAINAGFAFGCTRKGFLGFGSTQFNCPEDGDYSKVFCCGPSDNQYCCNVNTVAENGFNSAVDTVKNAADNMGKVVSDIANNCICNGDYKSDCCHDQVVLSSTIIIIIVVASAVVLIIIITIICCCCCSCCCAKKQQQGLVFIQPRAPESNVQVFIPNHNAPQDSYSLNQVAAYPGNSSDFGNGYPGAPQDEFPAVPGFKYDRKPLLNNPN
jgi:hypothetical protein